jgi:DNA-binding transcriptional regulator Cro
MAARIISTVPQLIEAFGGTSALARTLGRSAPAISQWRTHVPAGLYVVVRRACRRKGYDVSDRLFNFLEDDAKVE